MGALQVEQWDVEKKSCSLDRELFMGSLLFVWGLWVLKSWAEALVQGQESSVLPLALTQEVYSSSQIQQWWEWGVCAWLEHFYLKIRSLPLGNLGARITSALFPVELKPWFFCGFIYRRRAVTLRNLSCTLSEKSQNLCLWLFLKTWQTFHIKSLEVELVISRKRECGTFRMSPHGYS